MTTKITAHAIALAADRTQFAYEDDAGDMAFGPLCARTFLFDSTSDEEALSSHMSAAPGGHETVVEVGFDVTFEPLED